jgi:threonine/homoserine/homoserine lactone efflux protein
VSIETILAFAIVAGLVTLSPGPAVLLALRNGATHGIRCVMWSSLGNVSGLFCLSAAAMLGLGVLLKSSAFLFGAVKVLGALYLFYVGLRHVFGHASALNPATDSTSGTSAPRPLVLYREAYLMAATNPKPILFLTALFPQFISAQAPLLPQFFVLTGIYMGLSFVCLMGYALVAVRARKVLLKPNFAKWINRLVGSVFISFGAALLALRRPAV